MQNKPQPERRGEARLLNEALSSILTKYGEDRYRQASIEELRNDIVQKFKPFRFSLKGPNKFRASSIINKAYKATTVEELLFIISEQTLLL